MLESNLYEFDCNILEPLIIEIKGLLVKQKGLVVQSPMNL